MLKAYFLNLNQENTMSYVNTVLPAAPAVPAAAGNKDTKDPQINNIKKSKSSGGCGLWKTIDKYKTVIGAIPLFGIAGGLRRAYKAHKLSSKNQLDSDKVNKQYVIAALEIFGLGMIHVLINLVKDAQRSFKKKDGDKQRNEAQDGDRKGAEVRGVDRKERDALKRRNDRKEPDVQGADRKEAPQGADKGLDTQNETLRGPGGSPTVPLPLNPENLTSGLPLNSEVDKNPNPSGTLSENPMPKENSHSSTEDLELDPIFTSSVTPDLARPSESIEPPLTL